MRERYYPGANRVAQDFSRAYPGARIIPNVVVAHTTETSTWPQYGGGKTAPHFTVYPDVARKRLVFRQHFPLDMSARALRNEAGGVETNTLNAVQVELVGTCNRHGGGPGLHWPDAPDWALEQLADFAAWLSAQWVDIPLKDAAPRGWLPYDASYGNRNGQRMTFAEWRNAYGWVGHQHVPENSHGDPGNLDIERILQMARKGPPKPLVGNPTVTRVGTANVRSSPAMRPKYVREDYERLRDAMEYGVDFWGLQEIGSGVGTSWMRPLLKDVFPLPDYQMRRLDSGEVVLYDTSRFEWLWVPSKPTLLHESVPFVCGRRNIDYIWVWDTLAQCRMTLASVHLTPKKNSNRRAADAHAAGLMRLRKWIRAQLWHKAGTHIVISGDWNCSSRTIYEALGREIDGVPVTVLNTGWGPHGKAIDHVVLVGDFEWGARNNLVGQRSDHRPAWFDIKAV